MSRHPRAPSGGRSRRIVNAVTLATPVGLGLARLGRARLSAGPRGTVLAVAYRLPLPAPRAAAVTIGDVVLLRLDADQVAARPRLLEHEVQHAEQWARGLGMVGFPLAYGLASLWSWLTVGDAASNNVFERAAGLADGGYGAPDLAARGVSRWRRRRARR